MRLSSALVSGCRNLCRQVADGLLPALCVGCSVRPGPDLCAQCRRHLTPLLHPCPRCGRPQREPLNNPRSCRACRGHGWLGISEVIVGWNYEGLLQGLITSAKASADRPTMLTLATLMPAIEAQASIVPVPPAPGRRHGPHLATVLARHLAHHHGLPLVEALRCRHLAAEQHRLNAGDRRRNVEDLFVVRRPVGGTIVLVDDLLTSGATASAAALALRRQDADRVILAVLARTPRSDDPKSGWRL